MKRFTQIALATIAIIVGVACCVCDSPWTLLSDYAHWIAGSALLATSFSGGFGVQDANQSLTLALPNAASTTANSANSLDTMCSSLADFQALSEVLITAPALNTTVLPDTKTMTYALLASANSNMAGAVVVVNQAILQTGAGGVGAAAATARIRLPTNIGVSGRYIGLQAVSGANTTNAAALNGKLQMLF